MANSPSPFLCVSVELFFVQKRTNSPLYKTSTESRDLVGGTPVPIQETLCPFILGDIPRFRQSQHENLGTVASI